MAIVEVDPISRIEGHLGVTLDHDGTKVTSANVHGNLWRGFENFLIGRDINDAITFTQRICGVCPVPHGQTATNAAESVLGYNNNFQTWIRPEDSGLWPGDNGVTAAAATPANKGIPAKAVHIRNLVLGAEFLMSHITHSYHLAAPSYIQGPNIPPWTPYYDNSFYHVLLQSTGFGVDAAGGNANQPAINGSTLPVNSQGYSADLWSAVIKQYVKALRIRRLTFEAGALFAGRMPMTSCFVAGGVTDNKDQDLTAKCTMFRTMTKEVGDFVVKEFVPLFLALGALYPNYDNLHNAQTLQSNYPTLWTLGNQQVPSGSVPGVTNTGWGEGCKNFLAWGGFPQSNGTLALKRGTKIGLAGAVGTIDTAGVKANLREHIAYSRYSAASSAVDNSGTTNPAGVTDPYTESRTLPKRDSAAKYSWLKAPRWNGNPMEVGPLARMQVAGFFQDDVTLASTIPTSAVSTLITNGKGYDYYTKPLSGTLPAGLDPAMVHPDIAVALVRAGLAKLMFNVSLTGIVPALSGAAQDWTVTNAGTSDYATGNINIADLTQSIIETAYGLGNAVITGAVKDFIVLLKGGASTIDRLRARPLESFVLVQRMIGGFDKGADGLDALTWTGGGWLGELAALPVGGLTYVQKTAPAGTVSGFGATEAPRGALMHMCTIKAGVIERYQCIVPTTWNASPKDVANVHGPMEQAMEDIPYSATMTTAKGGAGTTISAAGGVEALRVAQSFDPCIACAVH